MSETSLKNYSKILKEKDNMIKITDSVIKILKNEVPYSLFPSKTNSETNKNLLKPLTLTLI